MKKQGVVRKMSRISTLIALFASVLCVCGMARAQGGPKATLEAIDKELKPLLENAKANEDKIVGAVRKLLDFPTLCEDSLGKYWSEKTKEQQKEFSKTLQALIEKNVVTRLKDTKDHKITYGDEEIDKNNPKEAVVDTVVAESDDPRSLRTEITYIMRKKGNKWVVVDMKTDGMSLVSNYRSQFNKIITTDGWDALMKNMRDKLAE